TPTLLHPSPLLHPAAAPPGRCSTRPLLHPAAAPRGRCSTRPLRHPAAAPRGRGATRPRRRPAAPPPGGGPSRAPVAAACAARGRAGELRLAAERGRLDGPWYAGGPVAAYLGAAARGELRRRTARREPSTPAAMAVRRDCLVRLIKAAGRPVPELPSPGDHTPP